jgi:phage gp36-like protein
VQQLIDAFGEREIAELTDRESPRSNEVDSAVAQRACDRASVEIDASLASRYAHVMPLAQVPELLHYLALDLARFYLYEHEPPPLVQTRFDAARASLRELAAGRQSLGPDLAGAVVQPTPSDLPAFSSGPKDFARGAW